MTMHVFPVCMNCKYSFIIIPEYILRKMFQHVHHLFCRNPLLGFMCDYWFDDGFVFRAA